MNKDIHTIDVLSLFIEISFAQNASIYLCLMISGCSISKVAPWQQILKLISFDDVGQKKHNLFWEWYTFWHQHDITYWFAERLTFLPSTVLIPLPDRLYFFSLDSYKALLVKGYLLNIVAALIFLSWNSPLAGEFHSRFWQFQIMVM